MPITTLQPTTSHSRLKVFAAIAAVLAVAQPILGALIIANDNETLVRVHEGLGYLYAAAAVVTLFPAKVWSDLSHNKGLWMHALGMAVAGVVQVLLGIFFAPEEGQPLGAMMYVHIVLGVLILLGALGLFVMARRMPTIVTNVDGTPRNAE